VADIATSLNDLANFYSAQDKYGQTELQYQRALEIRERVLGPSHPHTIAVAKNYANLLRKMHREAEATTLEARF
jgi:hypothetical protein